MDFKSIVVHFDFNVSEPTAKSSQELAEWILKNKSTEILQIYGYCDSISSNEYNDKLALRRINSVLETLKSHSMGLSDKLDLIGFGKRSKQLPVQSDNRRVDIYFKYKANEESLSNQITQMKAGDKLRLKNLNFYNASGIIVPNSDSVLVELLQVMEQKPNLKIQIEGHICCEYQDYGGVSTLRCRTVYDYLTKNGIDKKRLSYKAFGSTKPLYPLPEQSEFERDENRRVEIRIMAN